MKRAQISASGGVLLPLTALLLAIFALASPAPTAAGAANDAGRLQAEVDIAVSGDSRGNLIGTVSKDNGGTGVPGIPVTVRGGSWTRAATTGENGFFAVATPLGVSGRVTIEAAGRELAVDATDLPLRLTARPRSGRLSLEGKWEILVDPTADWRTAPGWRPIDVPSNWEMKGFRAASGTAVMRRTLDLPDSWRGKTIKLRADGIYSRCEAWLNGIRVGSHDGGATPVELDLTGAARPGRTNTLDVFIWARSRAADIDHMSVYAYFEIAGIWRPIEVFAVEPVHVSRDELGRRLRWGSQECRPDRERHGGERPEHGRRRPPGRPHPRPGRQARPDRNGRPVPGAARRKVGPARDASREPGALDGGAAASLQARSLVQRRRGRIAASGSAR